MWKTRKLYCRSDKGTWMSKETDHVTGQKNTVLWECPFYSIQCINLMQLQLQAISTLEKNDSQVHLVEYEWD